MPDNKFSSSVDEILETLKQQRAAEPASDQAVDEILADLGAVNIADSDTSLLEDLSLERIIADDPDYIFVVFQGSDQAAAQKTLDAALTSNPAWDTLSAVQNGHFYLMEKELYHLKPNARWGEAYQKVADILYPAA